MERNQITEKFGRRDDEEVKVKNKGQNGKRQEWSKCTEEKGVERNNMAVSVL